MSRATMPVNIVSGEFGGVEEIWDRICSALLRYRRLFVFANFDGTLSELVNIPSSARLDADTERALRRLCAEPRISVAVISGRSVDDIASRIGLPIAYAGDHGLEIHTPDVDFTLPEADAARRRLPELCNRIRGEIQQIAGALVEAKRLTATVHFRHVRRDRIPALLEIVGRCVAGTEFHLRTGSFALEISPRVGWGKGDAVSWLLNRNGAVPEQSLLVGGETDEEMFERFPAAVNIRVTSEDCEPSAARYCMRREDIAHLLHGLADVAEGCAGSIDR